MKSDNGLYKLIYEYFETRLLYGYYACGDSLPSIARISTMFRMAPGTVRSALALLEKKGYIRIDARKTARVIYEAPETGVRETAALYFVPRRDGILDLAESGKLLFEPLWEEGLRRMDDKLSLIHIFTRQEIPGAFLWKDHMPEQALCGPCAPGRQRL